MLKLCFVSLIWDMLAFQSSLSDLQSDHEEAVYIQHSTILKIFSFSELT